MRNFGLCQQIPAGRRTDRDERLPESLCDKARKSSASTRRMRFVGFSGCGKRLNSAYFDEKHSSGPKGPVDFMAVTARLKSCPKKKQECKFNKIEHRPGVLRTPTHRTKTKASDGWGTVSSIAGRQRRWTTVTRHGSIGCFSAACSTRRKTRKIVFWKSFHLCGMLNAVNRHRGRINIVTSQEPVKHFLSITTLRNNARHCPEGSRRCREDL